MVFATVEAQTLFWKKKGLRYCLVQTQNPSPPQHLLQAQSPRPSQYSAMQRRIPQRQPCAEQPKPQYKPQYKPQPALPKKEEWPNPWQDLFSRVKPGLVVWTYPFLGSDLLHIETTDVEIRRQFLGRVLSEKPVFPQGTHTFWPYCLPNAENVSMLDFNIPVFWAGVLQLRAQVVCILGPKAGETLLHLPTPFAQSSFSGVAAIVFHDIATLRENQSLFSRTLYTLRAVLSQRNIHPLEK